MEASMGAGAIDSSMDGPTMTVAVGSERLAYREQGTGTPVVFVHGGINDWRTWQAQLPAIGERYRAVAYSRRYAWPNDPIPDGVDDQMKPHVDDLIGFIGALDLAPVHLVGNSWGAFICILLAIREPRLLRTLTLEEPPVLPLFVSTPPKPSELLRLIVTRPRTAAAIVRFMATGFAPSSAALKKGNIDEGVRIFAEAVLGKESYAALPGAFKQQMRDNAKTHAAQFLGKGFPSLAAADVQRIDVPTLLVTGQHSPGFLLRLSDRLAELLPQVERIEISGASHVMHAQNAPELNRALLAFLSRHADS